MKSCDRFILSLTLLLMLAMSSADIHCKMKAGCSTHCDPIGLDNIEEHLFNKEFSITCQNNGGNKLHGEIEDLKTNYKDLLEKFSKIEIENRDLKDSSTKMQEKYDKIESKFESKFREYEATMIKNVLSYEKKVADMNKTGLMLGKQMDGTTTNGCHEVNLENVKDKKGTGGVFDIHYLNYQIEAFCDLTTDGGKWTVFQRRFDGSQDFNQDWKNYVEGFGNLTGEFWFGLEKMHLLTQKGQYELRIEMTNKNGRVGIAEYQTFSISGSSDNYRLNIGGFRGTGVRDYLNYHNNMDFSTRDRDHDKSSRNCAVSSGGGWWFNGCFYSMLNQRRDNIYWSGFSNNIRKTEMKFRKK